MTVWHVVFSVCAYLAAATCLYAAARFYFTEGFWKALREVLLFVLFAVAYWMFESYTLYVMPSYYYYPPVFWDTVPNFDWSGFSWVPAPVVDTLCQTPPEHEGISRSVPLMEASITYSMMWTARLLAPKLYLLQPFMVGLGALTVDTFLDPIAATSYHGCTGAPLAAGLGFWEWHIREGLGLQWFHVPLFNYAAWYAAPIALVALALLLKWGRDFAKWVRDVIVGAPNPTPPSLVDAALRWVIVTVFGLLFFLAPTDPAAIQVKQWTMIAAVAITILFLLQHKSLLVRSNGWRVEFIVPQALFHGFSVVALLFASAAPPLWPLLLVGLVMVPLGLYYAISPYFQPGAPAVPPPTTPPGGTTPPGATGPGATGGPPT